MNNARQFRVGFCISGGGRLFRAAVHHAAQIGIVPALVVAETKSDPSLAEFCASKSIDYKSLNPKNRLEFDEHITRLCAVANLDLLCLTFDRLIPAGLVRHYRHRIINVHMGLLPAFKGMHALNAAIESGVRFAGATIHEVDELMDNGAVIAQCAVGVRREDTNETIGSRMFVYLRPMFLQVLRWYSTGRVTRDDKGRIWIVDGIYGELPISPSLEDAFSD